MRDGSRPINDSLRSWNACTAKFSNSGRWDEAWGGFQEATPIRKEVDDAVLVRCTGLILFSDHMNISLVFFCSVDLYGLFEWPDSQLEQFS